ncbi:MAG: hypothetical protein HRU41_12270 [Saprospiraceae bacterium]|nr:hypothetical protein [Saprospiraceae bacterium]
MSRKTYLFSGALLCSLLLFQSCSNKIPKTLDNGYTLAYQQSFDKASTISDFEFSDTKFWQYSDEIKGGALECTGKSEYQPPVRSPHSVALISGQRFGSFVMEADLQQTGRVYNHQDMCVFFGFQDKSHFYYTHISKAMDDHANNVFVVDGTPRLKISTKTNDGQNWLPKKWHKIRLERDVESGSIRLFFDDMSNPVMEANDKRFGAGGIGFGSFDDSGKIDNIRIYTKVPAQKGTKHF